MTNKAPNPNPPNRVGRSLWSLVLVHVLVITPLARGDDPWTLTTADFRSERVGLRSIDDRAISLSGADSAARQLPLDRLLMLERLDKRPTGAAKFIAVLVGNDRAAGQPKSLSGENLVWENPTLGEITLPVKSVVSIIRLSSNGTSDLQQTSPSVAPTTQQQTEDVVLLGNGDSVKGIISGIGAAAVSIQVSGGETTDVPFDSIVKLTFASTGAAPAAASKGFRVSLADGSAVTATKVRLANPEKDLKFTLPDNSDRSVPMSQVTGIEQVNGPVVWLSSLRPTESVQTPFLDMSWPAQMDRAVDGDPIRFAESTFSRGIGVHSYSRLSFPIDPAMRAFRTQYAIAGDWPYANVTVRIKLDSQVVFERPDVRSGSISQPVIIDLDGRAKTLTLEVDYGQNYDVQDRFNWIEPALLKVKPEPVQAPAPPTTNPSTNPQ